MLQWTDICHIDGCFTVLLGVLIVTPLLSLCGKEGGARRPKKVQKPGSSKKKGVGSSGDDKPQADGSSKKQKSSNRKRQSSSSKKKKQQKGSQRSEKKGSQEPSLEPGVQASDAEQEESSQPGGGLKSEKDHQRGKSGNQPKPNLQPSENDAPVIAADGGVKASEKQSKAISANEDDNTPLHTDNYESINEKATASPVPNNINNRGISAGNKATIASTPIAAGISAKQSQPAKADQAPIESDKEVKQEEESDKESSKKSSKRKKKKQKKKKKDKERSSKKIKKSKKKSKKRKAKKEAPPPSPEEVAKKPSEPVVIYPYCLTPPRQSEDGGRRKMDPGLTTRLNDALLMTDNPGSHAEPPLPEAPTQAMSIQSKLPSEGMKTDKTQNRSRATTKLSTGVSLQKQQYPSFSPGNGENDKHLVSAVGEAPLPPPGPFEEHVTTTGGGESKPPISSSKKRAVLTTFGPPDGAGTSPEALPPPTPTPQQRSSLSEPKFDKTVDDFKLDVCDPEKGGSLAPTSQVKSATGKELNVKDGNTDWKRFLAEEAAGPVGKNNEKSNGKSEGVQKTQKSTTRDTPKPKLLPRSDKAMKIAKLGLKRGPADYPTMGDVVSDWSSADGVVTAAQMKEDDEKEIKRRQQEFAENEARKEREEAAIKEALQKQQEEQRALEERKKEEATALAGGEGKKSSSKSSKENELKTCKNKSEPIKEEKLTPSAELAKNREEEAIRVKELRKKAPVPKVYKRTSYEEKILSGQLNRKRHDYPTMNDIASDWESEDSSSTAAGSDQKQDNVEKKS